MKRLKGKSKLGKSAKKAYAELVCFLRYKSGFVKVFAVDKPRQREPNETPIFAKEQKNTAYGRAARVKKYPEPKDKLGPAARCKDVAKKMPLSVEPQG